MTTVVHCREIHDKYIGRTCKGFVGSKWANPFLIGCDGTRKEVVAKYRHWIVTQVELMASLHELKNMRLGCWCHPKECHGDFLAALTDTLIL